MNKQTNNTNNNLKLMFMINPILEKINNDIINSNYRISLKRFREIIYGYDMIPFDSDYRSDGYHNSPDEVSMLLINKDFDVYTVTVKVTPYYAFLKKCGIVSCASYKSIKTLHALIKSSKLISLYDDFLNDNGKNKIRDFVIFTLFNKLQCPNILDYDDMCSIVDIARLSYYKKMQIRKELIYPFTDSDIISSIRYTLSNNPIFDNKSYTIFRLIRDNWNTFSNISDQFISIGNNMYIYDELTELDNTSIILIVSDQKIKLLSYVSHRFACETYKNIK